MSYSQSYYQNVGSMSATGQPRYPPHLIGVVGNQSHFGSSHYPVHPHVRNFQYPVHSGSTQYPVHSSHVTGSVYPYPHHGYGSKATGSIVQQDIVMTSSGPMVRTIRRQF